MDLLDLPSNPRAERAVLVGVQRKQQPEWEIRDSLDELTQLAETAGAVAHLECLVKQAVPHPGYFIGTGKAAEIAAQARAFNATLVIFDDDLSPAQGRNLENVLGVRVIDRTQLILDIFALHAFTREGRLQIERAQLEYLLPRLRRMWTHLERQKGGIGLRGPGEQQLEMDRRRIQERLHRLKRDLERVRRHRQELRRGRRRHGWALVSLVGYTNAGKSTLLNALTGANVKAYNQLFATLDPTTRQLHLPGNTPALLTDTVGFIRKLPLHLVASFKATLEEVVQADLLLHVVDAAHPRVEEQMKAVDSVLAELGVGDKPVLFAFNKMDRPDARRQWKQLEPRFHGAVPVSARTGEGLDVLCDALADRLRAERIAVRLRIPLSESRLIATLRETAEIQNETYEDSCALFDARLPRRHFNRFAPFQLKPVA